MRVREKLRPGSHRLGTDPLPKEQGRKESSLLNLKLML